VALVGQGAGGAPYLDTVCVQARRQRVERCRVRDLPAEKAEALAFVAGHDQALLAVIHTKGPHRAGAIYLLHAEQTSGVRTPVIEAGRADADIAQRGQLRGCFHCTSPRCDRYELLLGRPATIASVQLPICPECVG
jgi:hypothetical protein